MTHNLSLVSTLAASFGLALLLGLLAVRLRMPTMVGYVLAGVIIGPATPGFVADVALASQLADIGVMLLMFGVGLHFSIGDLLEVRRIALPGALIQAVLTTSAGASLGLAWGWTPGASIILGLSLSVCSSVVLLRGLELRDAIGSVNGRIAIGWSVVQDLLTVLVLVMLPALANLGEDATGGIASAREGLFLQLGVTFAKVAAFVLLMILLGRRLLPRLLLFVARTGSRELFTLCVLAAAVGVAFGASALFEVSFALGAFIAGMTIRESELSHRAAEQSLPLRDAFAVLFFVSVGMLFDPLTLIEQPGRVLAVVAIVTLFVPSLVLVLVLLFRYPLNSALMVGASLAHVGEFSFVLAGIGVATGAFPAEGRNLVVAAAIGSIALNPLLMSLLRPLHIWLMARSRIARRLETSDDPLAALPMSTEERYLSGQVVLVGFGRVGRLIADALEAKSVPYVAVDQNRDRVEALRARNIPAVCGDAAQPLVLVQAHIARAGMLIVAMPDTLTVRRMAEVARTLNPDIEIVVRTHDEEESRLLSQDRIGTVFYGEHELATAMIRHVLARRGMDSV